MATHGTRYPPAEPGLLILVEDAYGDQSVWDVILHVPGLPDVDSVRRFLRSRRLNPWLVGEHANKRSALRAARLLSAAL